MRRLDLKCPRVTFKCFDHSCDRLFLPYLFSSGRRLPYCSTHYCVPGFTFRIFVAYAVGWCSVELWSTGCLTSIPINGINKHQQLRVERNQYSCLPANIVRIIGWNGNTQAPEGSVERTNHKVKMTAIMPTRLDLKVRAFDSTFKCSGFACLPYSKLIVERAGIGIQSFVLECILFWIVGDEIRIRSPTVLWG